MIRTRSLLPLVLLLACPPLLAQDVETLRLGTPTDGVLRLDTKRGSEAYVSYSFDVGEDVLAFTVELEASADLDLYLDSEYVDDYSDVLASSIEYSGSELIKLDVGRDPAQISPTYFIDVAYGRAEPPVNANGEAIREIPFTIKVTPFRQRVDAELRSGQIVSGRIDPQVDGPYRNYVVDVPPGTPDRKSTRLNSSH